MMFDLRSQDGIDDSSLQAEEERLQRELEDWYPRTGDRFFRESADGASLAGRASWFKRSDAFREAADRVVAGYDPEIDCHLIYPVLSLYRHYVELELKARIYYCSGYLSHRSDEECSAYRTEKLQEAGHNLLKLWHLLVNLFPGISSEMKQTTRQFERLLQEFHRSLPDSQYANYPNDQKGNPTLADHNSIDVQNLKRIVKKFRNYFETIDIAFDQAEEWEEEQRSW